jgi:protein-disulfide isomerase
MLTTRMVFAAVISAAAIIVIIFAVNSSGSRPVHSLAKPQVKTEKEVTTLLSGLPQKGNTLGQVTAPVTLQVFGDLQCEDVRTFIVWLLPAIIHDWVRTNVVKIQYRSFKTDTHDRNEFLNQQAAALAAGEQNKLWNFIETFYHEQGQEYTNYVTAEYLHNIATQVQGLDVTQWISDRGNTHLANQVAKDNNTAIDLQLHSTPSFLVGRTGGKMIKLLGDQIREFSGYERLRYPVSFIDSRWLKQAIEHLP